MWPLPLLCCHQVMWPEQRLAPKCYPGWGWHSLTSISLQCPPLLLPNKGAHSWASCPQHTSLATVTGRHRDHSSTRPQGQSPPPPSSLASSCPAGSHSRAQTHLLAPDGNGFVPSGQSRWGAAKFFTGRGLFSLFTTISASAWRGRNTGIPEIPPGCCSHHLSQD